MKENQRHSYLSQKIIHEKKFKTQMLMFKNEYFLLFNLEFSDALSISFFICVDLSTEAQ
jgi:hypothetical protein